MKKNILIITLIMGYWSFSQEQKSNNTKTNDVKVKVITIDYVTKSFEDGIISSHLKVGDWVQFKVINIPSDLNLEGSIKYTNRNLELRNSYAGYIATPKEATIQETKTNTYDKIDKIVDDNNLKYSTITKEEEKSIEKNIKNSFLAKDKSLVENRLEFQEEKIIEINKNKSNFEKVYKLDENNMIKALEVNDALNFLKSIKTDAGKKALIDLKWQERLINILQSNIQNKLVFRKNLIDSLSIVIDTLNSKIKTSKTKTHYFPAFKIDNYDFTEIDLLIKNKDKTIINDNLKIPFSNYKGFKLDFSTGFVFNGLQIQNYKLLALDTDNVVIREEENGLSFNTGIALLAHAYQRSRSVANYAITTGLSFNLNNQNLNYVLGGSILLGDDQRFIISTGITAGRVKELVKYYKVDEAIPNSELSISAQVPVVEKLKASWFFSLTYNLGIGEPSKTIKL